MKEASTWTAGLSGALDIMALSLDATLLTITLPLRARNDIVPLRVTIRSVIPGYQGRTFIISLTVAMHYIDKQHAGPFAHHEQQESSLHN
jgi:hypothetical protein